MSEEDTGKEDEDTNSSGHDHNHGRGYGLVQIIGRPADPDRNSHYYHQRRW